MRKILIIVGVAVVGLMVAMAIVNSQSDDGKKRPDTPESRREFVQILTRDMPPHSMWTEGAADDGLVIDLIGCDRGALILAVTNDKIADRLEQFDFKWVRCPSGARIVAPWK